MATQVTTSNPVGWANQAAQSNWQAAQAAAARPYTPYTGNMLAGWGDGQATGYNAIMNGAGVGMQAMQQGQGAVLNAAQYGPQQIQAPRYDPTMRGVMNTAAFSAGPAQQMAAQQGNAQYMNRGQVQNVQAGQFPGADLGQYMNPYVNNVVNTTLGQLGRQNDILQNGANAKAMQAGAFGGSRQAIMNSENNRNFMDVAANTSAGLYSKGFDTAQSAIKSDQDRAMEAARLNQTQDYQVGKANLDNQQAMELQNLENRQSTGYQNMLAGNEMARYNTTNAQNAETATIGAHNTALADQAEAANRAGEFNSEMSLKSQAANQLAGQAAINSQIDAGTNLSRMGLDEQARAQNAAKAQYEMGTQRTAFDQSALNLAQQQWQQQQDYPLTQLDILQKGLSGAKMGEAKTSPYYPNTGANVVAGALGGAQALSYLPGAIQGVQAGYNALSPLWNSASQMPNNIWDSGAMSAEDLMSDYSSWADPSSWSLPW